MVALGHALVSLSALASTVASLPQHEKRLFGLDWYGGGGSSPTTTSTTSSPTSTSTSSSSTVKTTSTSTTSSSTSSSTSTSSTTSSPTKAASTTSTTSSSIKLTSSSTSSAPLATGTNTPYGNTLVFEGFVSIVGTSDKLGTYTLNSYSPQACSTLCKANPACSFYNVYSAMTFMSFVFGTTPYCALYDGQHSAWEAYDYGTFSGMSYSNSNGYVMFGDDTAASVIVSTGTAGIPTSLGTSMSSSTRAATSIKSTSAVTTTTTSSSSSSSTSTSTSTSSASSTKAAITSSSSSSSSSVTSSSSANAALNAIGAVVTSAAAAVPAATSIAAALPSSTAAAAVAAAVSSAAAKALSTPVALSSIVPATSVAVPTTLSSVAVPTKLATSLAGVVASATKSVSVSAACSLPGWAYSGWCSTLPSMVPQIKQNVLGAGSANRGFIVPLYIYPSWWTNPGAWDWVYTAAANYPSVTFTVIVNPNSGPGTTVIPNSDYQHELTKLLAIANVNVLGYVDTAFGGRAAGDVANDISIYAGWSSAGLGLDGIFFDNQASGQTYLSMYSSYASQVRANAGFSRPIVGFAPGQICHPSFVDVADFVVIFEQTSAAVPDDLFGWYASFLGGLSAGQLSKLVFMLNSADAGTSVVVTNLQAALNPRYLYLTDNTAQWGGAFQSAPSASFLAKALDMVASPLALVGSVVANL
ncbi:Putative uncharacterized protein [Taphrina deformans PYCC 5710]|uniref:Apple domain-containing protein n=1 Tax=Taphrina deformans (strain PYCC 5710 / ATCC 11124 / CBS 356.35 / IMI 108563 / JCM 9778 / NBRC 8474) TaxID=1097556 RepID=R4X9L9_TAPDE|nr:Putative uncharacterized protein [Taphrina deformans PYCC 5710]|eukprot:CCG82115.1 Putative uncharacterized protein [Taphrina deformans PYCC 5710]